MLKKHGLANEFVRSADDHFENRKIIINIFSSGSSKMA
jgi:hypothetical protein